MKSMNEVINTFLNSNNHFANTTFPKFSVVQKQDIFEVTYALAGYSKEDIRVEYDKEGILSVLQVSAEPPQSELSNDDIVHYNYISTRDFRHKIRFPYNSEVQDCTFKDGLLTVMIKVTKPDKDTNRITIN